MRLVLPVIAVNVFHDPRDGRAALIRPALNNDDRATLENARQQTVAYLQKLFSTTRPQAAEIVSLL